MKKFLLLFFISLPLLLRIYTYNKLSDSALLNYYAGDSLTHIEWAEAIKNQEWDRVFPLFRAPVYGFFLALVPSESNYLSSVRIIQHILGLLTVLLTFLCARFFLPFKYAISAAIIFGILPVPILMETQLYITSLYTFFSLLLCYLLLRVNIKNIPYLVLLSFTAAIAILTRPNILFFIAYISVFLFSKNRKYTVTYFIVPFILFISPFIILNSLQTKSLTFISTQGIINLHAGNSLSADGLVPLSPELPENTEYNNKSVWSIDNMWLAERAVPSLNQSKPLSYKEINSFWLDKIISDIKENPFVFFKRLFFKLFMLFGAKEIPNNLDPVYFLVNYLPLLGSILVILPFSIFSALAFTVLYLQFFFPDNKHKDEIRHFSLYLLTSALVLICFFVNSRFRVPLLPVLSIFSLYAIYRYIISTNPKLRKKLAIISIFSLLFFSSTLLIPDSWQVSASKALFHEQLAKSHLSLGNYRNAIIESDNALNLSTNEQFIFLHTRAIITDRFENNPVKALEFAKKSVALKRVPQNVSFLNLLQEKVKKQEMLKQ